MHSLMRQAKLLGDLPKRDTAAVEVEDSLVVGDTARLGCVQRSFVVLAELLDLIQRIHVYAL
jgi:hypothetical protein